MGCIDNIFLVVDNYILHTMSKKSVEPTPPSKILDPIEHDIPWYENPVILFTGTVRFIPTSLMTVNEQRAALARSIILLTIITYLFWPVKSFVPVIYGSIFLLLLSLYFNFDADDDGDRDILSTPHTNDVNVDQYTRQRMQLPVFESSSRHPPRPSDVSQIYSTRTPQHTNDANEFGTPVGLAKILSHR